MKVIITRQTRYLELVLRKNQLEAVALTGKIRRQASK